MCSGRRDGQVKLRGFRIELGEIEAVLRRYPGVSEAVVTAHTETDSHVRLVAYVETAGESVVSESELRRQLAVELPQYMMPSAIVRLAKLPLTPNGKVDRKALPAPDGQPPELKTAYVEPRNDLERIIASIWRETLHLEKVGVNDDFFALGGDSINSIQIVARASRAALKIATKQIFQYPTIAELAAVINSSQTVAAETDSLMSSDFPDTELTQKELDELVLLLK